MLLMLLYYARMIPTFVPCKGNIILCNTYKWGEDFN